MKADHNTITLFNIKVQCPSGELVDSQLKWDNPNNF